MRILWKNYIDEDSSFTPYTEDENYPVENIYNTRLSRVYHTLGIQTTEYIQIKETITPEYVALVNHNVSSSCSIYLDGASSSGMSTLTYTETLTWSSYTIVSTISSTVSCDYFKLRIVGMSTATYNYIELGYFFLGDYIEMPGMKPNQIIDDFITSRITVSEGGQGYGDDGYLYRSPQLEFPYLSQTQRDDIREVYNYVKNYIPVILLIWPSSTEETPIYSIIDQNQLTFTKTDDYNLRWSTKLKFREVF